MSKNDLLNSLDEILISLQGIDLTNPPGDTECTLDVACANLSGLIEELREEG